MKEEELFIESDQFRPQQSQPMLWFSPIDVTNGLTARLVSLTSMSNELIEEDRERERERGSACNGVSK